MRRLDDAGGVTDRGIYAYSNVVQLHDGDAVLLNLKSGNSIFESRVKLAKKKSQEKG